MADQPLKVLVLGDICLAGEPESDILSGKLSTVWAGIRQLLSDDTVLIANIEGALTENGAPRPFKWACLRASPKCVSAIEGLGVAVIANNHISDFGDQGVRDTIAALDRSSIRSTGCGETLDAALRPVVVEKNGARLAIVALSCPTTNGENLATHTSPGVPPLGVGLLRLAIAKARQMADAVVIYLHWGQEQTHEPVHDQVRLARRAIEYGADIVLGCHSHTIQSYENYLGRWIFYGLGNYLFGTVTAYETLTDGSSRIVLQKQHLPNRQSLAVQLTLRAESSQAKLHLDAIHALQFESEFVPHIIPMNALTINLERLNRKLSTYVRKHQLSLHDDSEPVFQARACNGVIFYYYPSRPISLAFRIRRVGGRIRRAISGLAEWISCRSKPNVKAE